MMTPDLTATELDCGGAPIVAFSTMRGCCTPSDPYSGFSTCHYVGDSPARVAAARLKLAEHTGLPQERHIIPRQTHSLHVAVIDRVPFPAESLEDTDALVTSLPDTALCIHTADCVPVVMADAAAGVIAAVHSGWKGTVGRISALAVNEMAKLGADPARIVAAMGPCIGPECFEVGPEVTERFTEAGFPDSIIVPQPAGARPHIDLPGAVAFTLKECGLTEGNIHLPPACSRCRPDTYFSARRLGVASGRTLTVIVRRECLGGKRR